MKEGLKVWGMVFLVIFGLVFGIMSFKHCYDDHRNELNFSVWTSMTACSG